MYLGEPATIPENGIPNELLEPTYIFPTPDTPRDASKIWRSLDTMFFWRSILALVAWLHLVYHLPHKACNLVLRVLKSIFILLDVVPPGWTPIISLQTVFRRLDLKDKFSIMAMCKACRRLYSQDSPATLKCSGCENFIFEGLNPKLKYPFCPISQQLAELIMQPGLEDHLESWRSSDYTAGEYRNISDGRIWNSLKGEDGRPFFDRSPDRPDRDELRIALTLGFDG